MLRQVRFVLSALLLLTSLGHQAVADDGNGQSLALAAPFTENMVLQREKKVAVWGFDTPGSRITVEFAGQSKHAVADRHGNWKILLDPLKASSTERSFKVTNARGETIVLNGVLVGEVWFSSGQSNMVWISGKSMCVEIAREIAGSAEPIPIREINIDTVSALYPKKHATSAGGWQKATAAHNFSALSLSFAYELYKELKVPIGILLSAHSNTRIEAFTSRPSIEAHSDLAGDVELMHKGDPLTPTGAAAFEQYVTDLRAWQEEAGRLAVAGGRLPSRPNLPGIAGMWRGPSQFFNGKIAPVIPYAIRGAIWCQGTSNSHDGRIYAARMEALVRGWRAAWDMPDMPFYFTQMQCYGAPNPDTVGFADIRQSQYLFFMNNRDNVGMVVQSDLNSARPQGIHYWNKLHPGMRMARWALAKQYGREIAFTGPIYDGYEIKGEKVVVSFEPGSLFGGLMVGSKGMAKDYREPGKYVEPARPTPGAALTHFRLCGEDRVWHAAEAVIVGDTVEVRSKAVPRPIGVQYAYSAVPENSNLYNKAGLPATPFAAIDGKLIFQEDARVEVAAPQPDTPVPPRPMLHVVEYFRHGAVVQRDQPIPVWGHANAGATVTVSLGDVSGTATANALEQWSVQLPPIKASTEPLTLHVEASNGRTRTVQNILVGDVWFLTGSPQLTSEWPYDTRSKDAALPEPLPLVREFRRKTKASSFATPRKRRFETGGGRYRSSWQTAEFGTPGVGVTMFAYTFAKALNRPGIPQGFITMAAGHGGRARQLASPLSWTSYAGIKDVKSPAFKARLDELALQYPNSEIAKRAVDAYLDGVRGTVSSIIEAGKGGADMLADAELVFPAFPDPGRSGKVTADTIPTYTYNWCVSPFTPMAVSGVIWVPSQYNIGEVPAQYAEELEIYAHSLPATYGKETVQFIYAHPGAAVIEGITEPDIPGATAVPFEAWPKSLKALATEMAGLAE